MSCASFCDVSVSSDLNLTIKQGPSERELGVRLRNERGSRHVRQPAHHRHHVLDCRLRRRAKWVKLFEPRRFRSSDVGLTPLSAVPSNLLLTRISPRWWIPTLELVWGLCTLFSYKVTSYQGLYAVRFFVGLAEAGFCKSTSRTSSRA